MEGNYPKHASRDSLIGLTIARRYTITDFIARGGTGTVYLARDNRLDRFIALKIMHDQLTHDPFFLERFKREAKSAAQLDDPHVVVVHDQGEDSETSGDDIIYLAMEYSDGYSLRQVLRHHRALDVFSSLKIILATLKGLAAAHRAHIIHRDVKPENVLISSNGRVKLGDFGLAKSVTATTHTGVLVGTIAYLAPETISSGTADERSDIYAIGVMLYEMLTGELPFPGDITQHIAYQHVNNAPPLPSEKVAGLPPDLDRIVTWSMAKNPEDRPENAQIFLAEVEKLQASLTEEELSVHSPRMLATPLKAKVTRNTSILKNSEISAGQATRVLNLHEAAGEEEPFLTAHTHDIDVQSSPDGPIISTLADSGIVENGFLSEAERFEGGAAEEEGHLPKKHDALEKNGSRRIKPKYTLRRSKAKTITWIFFLLLLSVMTAGGAWFFAAGPGATATIPDTVGASLEEAHEKLAQFGFSNIATEQVFNDSVDKGLTIGTQPEAGKEQRKFSLVTLQVSKGSELFKIPSLTGLGLDEAKTSIAEAGFEIGSVVEKWHDTVPAGKVVQQTPAAGQEARKKATIDLTVSKGKEPVPVPNVIGRSHAEASNIIKKAGFSVETVAERDYHRTIRIDHVISQTPADGMLPRGATIAIKLSKGPRMVKVPDVRRMNAAEAKEKLEKLGFEVRLKYILEGILGLVQGRAPENDELPEGSAITLNVV